MNKIIFSITFLLFQLISFAQAPIIEWQKSMGGTGMDVPKSVKQTSDGGSIVAGYTYSNNLDVSGNHGGYDAWIVKLSNLGIVEWKKTIGGTNDDYIYSIVQTTDGGYFISGYSASNNGDVSGNHGGNDIWVAKLSDIGDIQWQKSFGGTGEEISYKGQQTSDGGYIVCGYTYSTDGNVTGNHGGYDGWIIKMSSLGVLEWQKTYGGTLTDYIESIQQTIDGGYILAGYSSSTNGDISGNHGGTDMWVVKISSSGSIQWQRPLGGSNTDQAKEILQIADGSYIVVGYTGSVNGDVAVNQGSNDAWVVKLSSSGNLLWQKTFGGTLGDGAYEVLQDIDGGIIIGCSSTSVDGDIINYQGGYDVWIFKLNASGIMLWKKNLGGTGSDFPHSMVKTSDGGCLIASVSDSSNGDLTLNLGFNDFWIVKLSADNLSTTNFSKNKFNIYPNPVKTILQIKNNDNLGLDKVIISDLTGKEVLNQNEFVNQINLEQLTKGMYFITFYSGLEKYITKFIKE